MGRTFNMHITTLDYAEKTLLVLVGASIDVSLSTFSTVIGTLVAIASSSINLVYLISNGIFKTPLKTVVRKKHKHRKIVLSARSKLNSEKK